ncbi:efflux RND transporter periplasmic adaptor subunit [Chitinophaga sp. G-6-1-13]|uniref:Efflux RND transporter periplasmic adaptor subunit n=1 Tax=Chitinophaga fulva TaxID=2728842 RepID=A0A848GL27_9BACT|nr:efflux RND transporter periplasmic adaptor subunit [Chitinophaga fulva]NML36628.1 efflux RND transporter periplasmic adaptor subunit [Chitinophaga fulva]
MQNLTRHIMSASLAGILLSSCGNTPGNDQQWGAGSPQPFPVATVAVANTVLNEDYPAVLEGQQNVEIRPKIDGFIEYIYIDEGAMVTKGELLFKIQAPQYEQEVRTAEAAIKSAEASVNAARIQLDKAIPLAEKGIVNKFEVDESRYNLQVKEAALAQARASLVNAKTNIGYTTIVSPINGIIGAIPFKTGSLVSSAAPQPLTTVSDIRKIYAYFSLNEKQFLEFADASSGERMDDKIKSFPPVSLVLANGKEYGEKGKLETVGGLINTTTGSATFRATFNNPSNIIRSGSSATIRINRALQHVIIIPQSATYELQDKKFVYVVSKDGTVKSREITVHPISNDRNYVVEAGLSTGEKIVTEGMGNLKDSMKIIPTAPSKMAALPAY